MRDVLAAGTEFTQAEKEELEVKILEAKRQEWAQAASLLEKEHTRQRDRLAQMEDRNATKLELDEQKVAVRRAYEAYRLYTVQSSIQVPDQLFDLLDTDACTKRPKVWILWYCHNGGNPVDACSKSDVTYRTYQKWIAASEASVENLAFRTAKEDVERAQMDVAEQILKSHVAKGDLKALVFFLKGRHDSYRSDEKLKSESKSKKSKDRSAWTGTDPKLKQTEFAKAMSEVDDM